jgi:transcriptional regulator
MYIPAHFSINDLAQMHEIIQTHPLGALVTMTPEGLDANHIPFELDADRGVLTAHVARANPVWQQCGNGMDALVIFRGEESYISPNWYPSKHEFHRQVPTWNYEVVHVHGRMTVQDTEKFVRGVVGRLTRKHEAIEPKPWKMGDSAPEYIDGMLRAIVGIEIAITRLEGKAKLSQNREVRDRLNAAEVLARQGEVALSQAMRAAN